MEKVQSTIKLPKLEVTDKNIHKRDFISVFMKHDLRALKKAGKISDPQIYTFKMEAKYFLSTLCNHNLQKSPLNSYFARCNRSLCPLYLPETPALREKFFSTILSKPVDYKQIQPSDVDWQLSTATCNWQLKLISGYYHLQLAIASYS